MVGKILSWLKIIRRILYWEYKGGEDFNTAENYIVDDLVGDYLGDDQGDVVGDFENFLGDDRGDVVGDLDDGYFIENDDFGELFSEMMIFGYFLGDD